MREVIYKYALKNALDYGKADHKAVLGKVLAEKPELKTNLPTLIEEIKQVIQEVNSLSKEEVVERVGGFEFEKRAAKRGLQDLPNPKDVVLRFAPNPSGPLHIGHCRAAVLNDEYARRYKGKFILRFEDTDPARVDPTAYEVIKNDLDWLGVEVHETYYQSDRLDTYYAHGRKLLQKSAAYVCTCKGDEFKRLRDAKEACPCRSNDLEENLARYERMFGEYAPEAAVVRLKTGLELPDPAMRDFVLLRITEEEHPRVKGKRVYPLYNFSVVVDDHLMKVTHVLRGKDHMINTKKQEFVYDYFGWKKPEFIHYGLLSIEGLELSTSLMAKGIKGGEYSGWEDVRLGTLMAMKRRGIRPEAIRSAMISVGIKETDISFSWANLYALNKELIDKVANRYFFVAEPRAMMIENCPSKTFKAPLHPDVPRGERELKMTSANGRGKAFISRADFESLARGDFMRLMDAFNVVLLEKDDEIRARFHSFELAEARERKARLIHWVPDDNVRVRVITKEGAVEGLGEKDLKKARVGDLVQFERYGFVRIDSIGEEIVAYFAHE